jgi:diphthine methyl ester acylhydrolase
MDTCQRLIASTQSLPSGLPPSCIEFCPAHPDYFVVGTYNLQKEEAIEAEESGTGNQNDSYGNVTKPQSRNGSLVVYRLTEDANDL